MPIVVELLRADFLWWVRWTALGHLWALLVLLRLGLEIWLHLPSLDM